MRAVRMARQLRHRGNTVPDPWDCEPSPAIGVVFKDQRVLSSEYSCFTSRAVKDLITKGCRFSLATENCFLGTSFLLCKVALQLVPSWLWEQLLFSFVWSPCPQRCVHVADRRNVAFFPWCLWSIFQKPSNRVTEPPEVGRYCCCSSERQARLEKQGN